MFHGCYFQTDFSGHRSRERRFTVAAFGVEFDAVLGGLIGFEEGAVPGDAVVGEDIQHGAVEQQVQLHAAALGEEELGEQLGALRVAEGEFPAADFVANREAPGWAFAELDAELLGFADLELGDDLEQLALDPFVGEQRGGFADGLVAELHGLLPERLQLLRGAIVEHDFVFGVAIDAQFDGNGQRSAGPRAGCAFVAQPFPADPHLPAIGHVVKTVADEVIAAETPCAGLGGEVLPIEIADKILPAELRR